MIKSLTLISLLLGSIWRVARKGEEFKARLCTIVTHLGKLYPGTLIV